MQLLPDNPPGTKIAKRVAKVRGVDPATLYFHGGELTRAARHRQHRRVTFHQEMMQRQLANQLIDNAVLVATLAREEPCTTTTNPVEEQKL